MVIGFYNPSRTNLFNELTRESLGFQHGIYRPESESKTWKHSLKFYNDLEADYRPKELLIHYDRKDRNNFLIKGILQFVPTRWDVWTPEQIEAVLAKLNDWLRFDFNTLLSIECFCDLERRPRHPRWIVAFSKNNARKTSPKRPLRGGYTEGVRKGGRGSTGKSYPKAERFFGHRLEVGLGRDKLRKTWNCRTIGEALRLDPFTVLCREAHFLVFTDSDWHRIFPGKPKRCSRLKKAFRQRGPVCVRKQLRRRERKQFHKLKAKLPIHKLVFAPGEIDIDEGSDD